MLIKETYVQIGQRLKNSRLKKKRTIEKISERTKISIQNLNNIENGNFHLLAGEFYQKSFIKSYCKELRISDKKLLLMLDNPLTKSNEDSKESRLKELTENKSQAYRVYDQDGLATTIKSVGGGIGAKTGLYKVKEATKTGYAIAQEGDSINLSVPSSKTRRGRVGRGVAQTLDTGMQQHTLQNSKIRRLTPIECERLQGFPDGWTEGLSDTQRYKCLGNAVTTNVVSEVIRSIYL